MRPRARNAAGTVVWSAVLGGSLLAIGAGFAGGHSYGTAALGPPRIARRTAAPPPDTIEPRDLTRMLRGARSLDAAENDPDRYGDPDNAVAMRPSGWAPRAFDPRRDRARVSVLVVDADRSASALGAFVAEPYPVAVVIVPETPSAALRLAREAGQTALVACGGAAPAAIAELRRAGAAGIACSTGDDARASALIAANRGGLVVDDLLDGDALLRAARRAGVPAISRDVTADAREDGPYVDFLLMQSLAIAQRTGVVTVALHARPVSREAFERFALRAQRSGVDLVGLGALLAR
jgi:Divergent polysaccharide deacetylase